MTMHEIVTAFSVGLLATTNPCVFPLYPGYLAFLSSSQPYKERNQHPFLLALAVFIGVMTMMVALGMLIAALAVPIGRVLPLVTLLADGLVLVMGVMLALNINPFKAIPTIQMPFLSSPFVNAYLYGLLYGPITLPCSAPLMVSIFALSLTQGEAIAHLFVFLWFGLGFGTPLLLLGLMAGSFQRKMTRFFSRHSRWVNLAGGLLLITIAVYDLSQNLDSLIIWLSFYRN